MEVPTRLELAVGEHYSLTLPGLGAAGYVWDYAVETRDGENSAVSVSMGSAGLPSPPGGSPPDSFSADWLVTINAMHPGRLRLRFFQHRPWEQAITPLQEHVIDIVVSD